MSTTINHKHIVWSDRDDTLCNILVTFRLLDNVVCEIGSVIRSETRFVSGVSFKKPNKMDKGWSLKSHLNLEAQEKVNCAAETSTSFQQNKGKWSQFARLLGESLLPRKFPVQIQSEVLFSINYLYLKRKC